MKYMLPMLRGIAGATDGASEVEEKAFIAHRSQVRLILRARHRRPRARQRVSLPAYHNWLQHRHVLVSRLCLVVSDLSCPFCSLHPEKQTNTCSGSILSSQP